MSPDPFAAGIGDEIRAVAARHGKVGLLVDDASDAESRVARELYGSEDLPPWWRVVQSLRCAAAAVDAFGALFPGGAGGAGGAGALILDRYLPARCGGAGRPIAWDVERARSPVEPPEDSGPEAQWCRAIQDAAGRLGDGREGGFVIELVTSHEHAAGAPTVSLRWRPRRMEPIRRLRLEIEERRAGLERLLHRGPVHRGWDRALRDVAGFVRSRDDAALLLTGPGASEARGRHGPGLPPLDTLPTDAEIPEGSALRRFVKRCVCHADRDPPLAADARGFSERLLERAGRYEERCRALHRLDRGFGHHHWLLAQMGWDAIVTTNWDGLHERAALAVARTTSPRDQDARARREELGTPVTWADPDTGRGRLYKLHDGLVYPGTSWSKVGDIVWEQVVQERLRRALARCLGGRHAFALVVLGMDDGDVRRMMAQVAATVPAAGERGQIYWIGGADADVAGLPLDHRIKRLPGTAVDFAFDLWRTIQQG